jgi:phosphoglycerol transferase
MLIVKSFFKNHINERKFKIFYKSLFLVLIAFCIFLDQIGGIGSKRGLVNQGIQRQTQALSFLHDMNLSIPGHCGIFQLPVVPFPENPPVNKLADYEQLLPSTLDTEKMWSYGAMKNTSDSAFLRQASKLSVANLIPFLKTAGFCGIQYDRRGYVNNSLERELQSHLGHPTAVGFQNNWLAFKL